MVARSTLSLLLTFLLMSGHLCNAAAQDPADRQSLIGEWVGEWTSSQGSGGGRAGGTIGPYARPGQQIGGERVLAPRESPAGTRDIRAKLVGNRLTFGNEQFQTELVIEGDRMLGTRQGGGTIPW